MIIRQQASVFEEPESRVVGAILDWSTRRILVFEREGEEWVPQFRQYPDGHREAFPSCFAPMPQAVEAMNKAYTTQTDVEFSYSTLDAWERER